MGQPKHILVVDDRGDVREVIVELLQNLNYRVSSVSDGALMRDFIKTGDPIDCVILDSVMPGETGISLALHLKEFGISVVMISGNPNAIENAKEHNLQLLPKPFRSDELFAAVQTALASGESGHRDA